MRAAPSSAIARVPGEDVLVDRADLVDWRAGVRLRDEDVSELARLVDREEVRLLHRLETEGEAGLAPPVSVAPARHELDCLLAGRCVRFCGNVGR